MKSSVKIVALDQNAWILLSRARYGLNDNQEMQQLVKLVYEAISSGKCTFPLAFERQEETIKHPDPARRQRLARFIAEISEGQTIGPGGAGLLTLECRNYLIDKYGIDAAKNQFPQCIMGRGVEGMMGAKMQWVRNDGKNIEPDSETLEKMRMAEELARSKEMVYRVLADDFPEEFQGRKELISDMDEIHKEGAKEVDKGIISGRRIQDKKNRKGMAELDFFLDTLFQILISEGRKLGFDYSAEVKKMQESADIREVLEGIPSALVTHELVTSRDNTQNQPVDPNDFNDISFMSYAVPYADVVVTERKWTNFSKNAHLDQRYGTRITSDILDLLSEL